MAAARNQLANRQVNSLLSVCKSLILYTLCPHRIGHMNHSAPLSLYLFVIILGMAVQLTSSALAAQASTPLAALGIALCGAILPLGYAVRVAYRRGYEAADAAGTRESKLEGTNS